MERQKTRSRFSRSFGGWLVRLLISCLFLPHTLKAEPPLFRYQPERLGAALLDGGWTVDRTMETIHGSPEFTFPLQLVYLSTWEKRGLFQNQWFCPQLESSLLPKGKRAFLWRTPAGNEILLQAIRTKAGAYRDVTGNWQAQTFGQKVAIFNADNWRFIYQSGRLISLTSPTRRVLEFHYKGKYFHQLTLYDPESKETRPLLEVATNNRHLVEALHVGKARHVFEYENGSRRLLLAWRPPGQMRAERFGYDKIGVLNLIQTAAGDKYALVTQFDPTLAVGPTSKKRSSRSPNQEVGNYRLMDDGLRQYRYGNHTGSTKYTPRTAANQTITLEDRDGGISSLSIDARQGVLTRKARGGMEEKTFYFLAPGKPFHGKVQREERNGVIVAENRCSPKTGLLVETRNVTGQSTYYTYAKPKPQDLFPPTKPQMIEKSTPQGRERVVTMKYDKEGRLVEKTDAADLRL